MSEDRVNPADNPEILFDHDKQSLSGAYESFDHGQLDSFEDRVKEARGDAKKLACLISKEVEIQVRQQILESIIHLIAMIVDSSNPRLKADAIAAASGIRLRQGISLAQLAQKHGVTRSYFCSEVHKIVDELCLPPLVSLRTEDSEDGREYAERNYRPTANIE